MRRAKVFALSLVLALAPAAWAQPPAEVADPDAVLVEELVVTGRLLGPAWWRVSDADTTVYVLGAPSVAPKHQEWDQTWFNKRLEGASQVILPFNGLKVKLMGAPGAAFSYLRLKSGRPFEDSLDAGERARFVAARTKLGQPRQGRDLQLGLASAPAAGRHCRAAKRAHAPRRASATPPTKAAPQRHRAGKKCRRGYGRARTRARCNRAAADR